MNEVKPRRMLANIVRATVDVLEDGCLAQSSEAFEEAH